MTGSTTDDASVALSRDDPAAFDAIFDRHARTIYRFAARRVGSAIAEDVTSEVFTRAFAARMRFEPTTSGSVLPWLFGIATNVIRSHKRSEERMLRAYARSAHDEVDDAKDERVVEALDAKAAWPRIAAALAELRVSEREAVLLLAWADLSYADIAVALDVPVGTVRTLIHRARTRLQARLSHEGVLHG